MKDKKHTIQNQGAVAVNGMKGKHYVGDLGWCPRDRKRVNYRLDGRNDSSANHKQEARLSI